ncbi:hypothetical protein ASPZODRAFT_69822 [Penicilliopsis zonata CBS 506.65]|uniref:Sphingolipid long chain base-responsive protein LSP1 n=1 Tax=Penicilliopsis zonata CBS 506.65 TaxID=1073090 RepID=A0A1L9SE62_9EURO|nr:hypothetical protein ASPZODRAFT_69822 [Penicilliopsis zonata CBS 506.65]OJJ45403.1 hypothetical protein ASPZODRAFT_69822 [Penicilliopsis zonata CBS 506.65]
MRWRTHFPSRNRSLSFRSKKDSAPGRYRFSIGTFRGLQQPELSRKLFKLIKAENTAIGAYESAGRERVSIASQLSDWGESTEDEAVSDISDKLGVLLAEIGEQEDLFAQSLEDYRGLLKQIRNTETSVQPTRDQRAKITDEIQKLKYKEPTSTKLVTLEQELVRAEAQNLVAEAQLTNVTRSKLKEAFDIHTAAVIERAEKQIILARHARRLLNFLDDSPIVPGDPRLAYEHSAEAKQVLEDAEIDLRSWERTVEPISSGAAATKETPDGILATAAEESDAGGAEIVGEGPGREPRDISPIGEDAPSIKQEKEAIAPEASGALQAESQA